MEVLNESLQFSLFSIVQIFFSIKLEIQILRRMVWTINLTPRKVCTTVVYNSSTSPAPRATSHLSAIHASQPQMILFNKRDKERKEDGTVQSISGAHSRLKRNAVEQRKSRNHCEGPMTKLKSIRISDKKHFHCQAPHLMFIAKKWLGKQDFVIYKENHCNFLINYTLLGQWVMIFWWKTPEIILFY